MARTRTLTQLIADCRRLAKMESSTFLLDADITEILNQELAELHGRLGMVQGQPLYRSSTTINVVAVNGGASSSALYGLPADFASLQGVEATINGVRGTILPFMQHQHGTLSNGSVWSPSTPVRYRIQGDNIEFLPATETFTATVYYTPCTPRLVNGTDVFDGYDGWEVAAIYGTVAQMLAMEESDPSFWEARKAATYRRIDDEASKRDASMPERVQDVLGVDTLGGPEDWWA